MEILSQASYPNLFHGENKSYGRGWTPEENKLFENALAVFDKETPDRWQKIAEMIPGKSVMDVLRQYKELEDDVSHIEAGLSGAEERSSMDKRVAQVVSVGSKEVWKRRLEKHISELCYLKDSNSSSKPCSEVLPKATFRWKG
ncbi:hypothetical protein MKW98_009218 [Papaver atlanticum]|uniref:Myb-like domain-containing protein n=1 Tax=Papaver atlanticum TaxID=357466 RepID=A0AAD4STG1_9MAGN|nr:hypothetical protein MKW98_009218 [Papaver atlanticum]